MKVSSASENVHRETQAVQASLIVAMAVWGLNITVVKQLTGSFDATLLASLRMLVAVGALTGIVLWKRCAVAVISGRQLVTLGVCGVLMVYLNQLLFAEGLMRTTATNGALIMALSPLVSALLASLAFKERLSLVRLAGVVLGFAGVSAVVLSHHGVEVWNAGTGDLLLIAAVVSFAVGGALVQRLARCLHPLFISWAIYVFGTTMLIIQSVFGGNTHWTIQSVFPGWWEWSLMVYSGVMATALSNVAWNRAIARIGVARTAVFLYWVPVFGVLFAALFLGERLTGLHLVGFAAVMSGTFLGTRRAACSSAF